MASLEFEGRQVPIAPGDTVASALYRSGVTTFGRSLKHHRRRGPYCLSGDCASCIVTVDEQPGIRSCTAPAQNGMRVRREEGFPNADRDLLAITDRLRFLMPVGFYSKTFIRPAFAWPLAERVIRRFTGLGHLPDTVGPERKPTRNVHADVVVIGAGIAGLAAARAADSRGDRVVLADVATIGEGVAPGSTLERIRALEAEVRALPGVTVLERSTAVGLYEGPLVPLVGQTEVVRAHAGRVIVATGAIERHQAFEGNDLPGVWLGRGAVRMAVVHGASIGRRAVVTVRTPEALDHVRALVDASVQVLAVAPRGLAEQLPAGVRVALDGRIVAAHGRRSLEGVTIAVDGTERTVACDALVLSEDRDPRDALLRMSTPAERVGAGDVVLPGCTPEEAEASGIAAAAGHEPETREPSAPPVPTAGYVCLCEDVTAAELRDAWDEGWRSSEILKRYTTATMGPCRGAMCSRLFAAFAAGGSTPATVPSGAGLAPGTGVLNPGARTTARPAARPVALEDLAAGIHETIEKRTALHERHLAMGGHLDWSGAWRRPLHYGNPAEEYRAVRHAVGIMDVGTLAKFLAAGRDATALLERVFPCHVEDLAPGRSHYLVALDEAGYVMDDGMLCALGGGSYVITSTSGGVDRMEAWLRNWADRLELHAHLVNRTAMLGAINVAGPRARELLESLGAEGVDAASMPHMSHRETVVAGVPCLAMRVGFVGEVSFELHHPRSRGPELWDALLAAGAELGIRPHGLDVLDVLRMEKGHFYLAQDTLPDDHPGKLGLDWAVAMDKPAFVGKVALQRMAELPLERRFVGLEFDRAPQRGVPLYAGDRVVGRVTSCGRSEVLGREIGLGWLRAVDGAFPTTLRADDVPARVVPRPFYDPEGARLRG